MGLQHSGKGQEGHLEPYPGSLAPRVAGQEELDALGEAEAEVALREE